MSPDFTDAVVISDVTDTKDAAAADISVELPPSLLKALVKNVVRLAESVSVDALKLVLEANFCKAKVVAAVEE